MSAPESSLTADVSAIDPVDIGDRVGIFIVSDNDIVFEGYARIVRRCDFPHWCRVRFEHEQVDRIRLVLPSSPHDNPALTAELLCELIRTRGLSPWSEFFVEAD